MLLILELLDVNEDWSCWGRCMVKNILENMIYFFKKSLYKEAWVGEELLKVILVRHRNVTHLPQLYLAVSMTTYELLLWTLAMPFFLVR